jgi:hypothetical protein
VRPLLLGEDDEIESLFVNKEARPMGKFSWDWQQNKTICLVKSKYLFEIVFQMLLLPRMSLLVLFDALFPLCFLTMLSWFSKVEEIWKTFWVTMLDLSILEIV